MTLLFAQVLLAFEQLIAHLVAGPVFVGAAARDCARLAAVATRRHHHRTGRMWARVAEHEARVAARLRLVALLVARVRHAPRVELGILHLFAVAVVRRWVLLLLVLFPALGTILAEFEKHSGRFEEPFSTTNK